MGNGTVVALAVVGLIQAEEGQRTVGRNCHRVRRGGRGDRDMEGRGAAGGAALRVGNGAFKGGAIVGRLDAGRGVTCPGCAGDWAGLRGTTDKSMARAFPKPRRRR